MKRTAIVAALAAALMITMLPANAAVHEITGADCNGRGGVNAPGQDKTLAALQATGFIVSIAGVPGVSDVTIVFDFDVPSSKYISDGGGVQTFDDFFGPGSDLTVNPGAPIPDPTFPAFANCPLFGLGG